MNQFFLQYFVLKRLGHGFYAISAPIVTANWKAASGNKWLVPIGGGVGRLTRVGGGRAITVETSAFYSAIHPQTAPYPRWTVRLQLQFLYVKKTG